MAQDLTNKRRDIASRLVAAARQHETALAAMEEAAREYTDAGLTWVQADFDGTALQHLTPGIATAGFTAAAAVRAYLISSFHSTNLAQL